MNSKKKNEAIDMIFWLAIILCMIAVAYCNHDALTRDKASASYKEPISTTDEPSVEVSEPEIAATLYNVPLDEELQLFIVGQAKERGIDPAIIVAMCYQESGYNADAIGDSGNSYGLMQIQERYHKERMERLGCTNLLDPYENVTVGIDFLSELIGDYYGDVEMALIAYNCGKSGAYNNYFSKGLHESEYSKKVMYVAEELRGDTYVLLG